jgi:cytochrome bd-type quinol oxidase subunit 2
MKAPVAVAVAIAIGLIILSGYFFPIPFLESIRITLLGWAVSLIGVATLIGIVYLIKNQWRSMRSKEQKNFYSPVLIFTFLITLVAGLVLTPASSGFQKVITSIQVPIETSLLAVVSVVLIMAGFRLIKQKKGWMSVVFLVSAILYLLIGSGIIFTNDGINDGLVGFLHRLPIAGGRGILIGVALGSLVTGLKIIFGAERPYSG